MSNIPAQFKAPPFAQVNLMPPEVGASRERSRQRRGVIVVFVLFLAAIGAGYFLISMLASQAEKAALAETERTAALQAEIASYTEVDAIKAQLANADSARQYAGATELFWPLILASVNGALPDGAGVQSFELARDLSGGSAASGPFDVVGIGTVTTTLLVPTYLDASEIEDRINQIPYFTRARVTSFTQNEGVPQGEVSPEGGEAAPAGPATYLVTATFTVTYDVLSQRFSPRWFGTDDQGDPLEEWYQEYYAALLAGNGVPDGYPPLPPAVPPTFVPGVTPGTEPAPSPEPSVSPSPEAGEE